nr:MAG TPA: hypothetical protein [Caudoviricetes sp.]
MSYKLTYTGQQVQGYLDKVATGQVGGGTNDYNKLEHAPVINQDLSEEGFAPIANTYYRHTGVTAGLFTQGIIYLYNGTAYKALDGASDAPSIDIVQVTGTSTTAVMSQNAVTQNLNGKYIKPSSGIPKADLASDVQSSLSKADTAPQSGDIPSKTSQLENDSNFVTEVELPIKSATLDSTTNTLYLTL